MPAASATSVAPRPPSTPSGPQQPLIAKPPLSAPTLNPVPLSAFRPPTAPSGEQSGRRHTEVPLRSILAGLQEPGHRMTVGSSSLHPPQQGGGSGRGGGPWPRVARSARLLLGGAAAAAGSGPAAASAAAAGSGAAASAASTSATMLRARLQAHMGRAWIGYSAALRHSPLITKCVTGKAAEAEANNTNPSRQHCMSSYANGLANHRALHCIAATAG